MQGVGRNFVVPSHLPPAVGPTALRAWGVPQVSKARPGAPRQLWMVRCGPPAGLPSSALSQVPKCEAPGPPIFSDCAHFFRHLGHLPLVSLYSNWRTALRLLCAFLAPIHGALRRVLRLMPGLLCAVFRRVVGLLGSLFHAVPCVFGRALCFVPRVLHILFCAAVLARGGLLTPSKSRSTHQRGSKK